MKRIADTGILVALLLRDDSFHGWARSQFPGNAPFHTCEAVIAEACSFLPTPEPILALLARGDLVIDPAFDLAVELPRLQALCSKYADRPMDLADACLVRMSELAVRCRIWTVDRADFTAYRRNGRQVIPCEFPS